MTVSQYINMAFAVARHQQQEVHKKWTSLSFRLGSQLPNSSLISTIQRSGALDSLIRSIEDLRDDSDIAALNNQVLLSEIWISFTYEIFRILKDFKEHARIKDIEEIHRELELVRVLIDKHQIAKDHKLQGPLKLYRLPQEKDDQPYIYSKDDPKRAHIPRMGASERNSCMWEVIDVVKGTSYWLERRRFSEKILELNSD